MDRRDGCFASFVLGALLGAIAALLYAPRSGKETREILKKTAEEYSERGKQIYEEKAGEVAEAIEAGKKTLEEKTEDLKGTFRDVKEKVSEKITDLRSRKEDVAVIEDLPGEPT